MNKTLKERVQALEDQQEIIKLKARYVNCNDGGWKRPTHTDPGVVAQLFAECGVWDNRPTAGYAENPFEKGQF